MAQKPIKIEGLKEFQFALRQANSQFPRELSQTNKAAAELVAKEGRKRAPELSGKLKKSIRGLGQQRRGIYAMGGARVPYYGVQEFGWPARNIRAQPFFFPALGDKIEEVEEVYLVMIDQLSKRAFPIPLGPG